MLYAVIQVGYTSIEKWFCLSGRGSVWSGEWGREQVHRPSRQFSVSLCEWREASVLPRRTALPPAQASEL